MVAWLLALAIGCGGDGGIEVHDREVEAGCGKCVFDLPDAKTCFWAMRFEGDDPTGQAGRFYAVGGVHPPDDMISAHQPGGMCAQLHKAHVDGSIRPDGRFVATRFDLEALEGDALPAKDHPH